MHGVSGFGGSTPRTRTAAGRAKPCWGSGCKLRALASSGARRLQRRSAIRIGCPPGETPVSRAQIAFHVDQSLRRLGVERIDLYYVHEFDRVTPLDETFEAITKAVEAGKIDRFGVSNASLSDVEAVRSLTGSTLASRFEYVQNEFNLLATADAEELTPYCAEHGLRYTAFSPLAGGFLTGKYRLDEEPPPGSRFAHAPEVCAGYSSERSFALIDNLRRSADARHETMAEAALRFVFDTPGVDGLIIAPRRVEHFASFGFEALS